MNAPGRPDTLEGQRREIERRLRRQLGAAEAEDLTQEAVLRCLERPPADGHFGPWLERVARNLMVDRWRRARTAERRRPEPGDQVTPPSPEEATLAGERRRATRSAVARLPRDQRRVVCATFWQTGPDIATAGVPPATMRTRLFRALGRLRRELAGLRVWVGGWASGPAAAVLVGGTMLAPPVHLWTAQIPADLVGGHQVRSTRSGLPKRAPVTIVRPAVLSPPKAGARPSPTPPVQRLSFEDDPVAGELAAPDHLVVTAGPGADRPPSLIEIPTSFVGELARSVEDL